MRVRTPRKGYAAANLGYWSTWTMSSWAINQNNPLIMHIPSMLWTTPVIELDWPPPDFPRIGCILPLMLLLFSLFLWSTIIPVCLFSIIYITKFNQ